MINFAYKIQNNRCGFTFPEIMLAICILGISLVGLLALFSHCVFLAERAKNLTTATSHAEYMLETIREEVISNPGGVTDEDWSRVASGQGLSTLQLENVDVTVTTDTTIPDQTIYAADVTVEWRDRTGNQSITISSQFNEP